jgi:hypothetical protein
MWGTGFMAGFVSGDRLNMDGPLGSIAGFLLTSIAASQ